LHEKKGLWESILFSRPYPAGKSEKGERLGIINAEGRVEVGKAQSEGNATLSTIVGKIRLAAH